MTKDNFLMMEFDQKEFIKERINEVKEELKDLEEQKKHLLEDLEIVKNQITRQLIELELKEIDWNIDWNLGRLNGLNELQEDVAQHKKKMEVE